MKPKWLTLVLLILLISGCSQTTSSESKEKENIEEIKWYFTLEEALVLAKKENQLIMADFYSDRCGWCQVLDRTTYTNSKVIELSKKFISLKIDCDRDRLISAKYRIRGLPTILFIDSKGSVVHSIVGYRKAEDFILEMEKALEKFRSGAAGLTSGIYTSRGRLKTLLIEKGIPGGLTAATDFIENYPGFPEGIKGMELMEKMKRQAEKFGTEIIQGEVKEVRPVEGKIEVETEGGKYSASCIIVASGSIPKKLNIPGEEEFFGRGVSYCATCDGPLYRDKDVAVIGCGNSGLQEGEYLLKFVKSITFVEFLPYITAEKILQERLGKESKAKFLLNHMLTRINGENGVNSVTVKDRKSGEEKEIPVSGVFIYVGFLPNSHFLKGVVKLNDSGYVITNEKMETSVPGIFAVGDVRSKEVRQVTTAAGEGTTAAVMAEKYIRKR